MPESSSTPKPRDPRLDFFRGLALLIIFVSHLPGNWLARYKPGAFGFSDSADIFVFVSGCAAAMAFTRMFRRAGFFIGTARIVKRVSELYACNLGLFFIIAALCVAGNRYLDTGVNYIDLLNLTFFFQHTPDALLALYALRWVPNYFDILTMYMVVLAMLPLVMLLARWHVASAVLGSIALYLAVPLIKLELPAEVAFDRPWFFNPFAWQFLFYTGFFLGAGWIKPPPVCRGLTIACAAFVLASIPLSHFPTYSSFHWLDSLRGHLQPFVDKTNLGILRWVHFLCLAYLAVAVLKGRDHVLHRKFATPLVTTGQQALPVFLTGTAMSFMGGMALDVWGRSIPKTILVNAIGIVLLFLAATVVAWFKSQPWSGDQKIRKRNLSDAKADGRYTDRVGITGDSPSWPGTCQDVAAGGSERAQGSPIGC
jgi:hypothetical protein